SARLENLRPLSDQASFRNSNSNNVRMAGISARSPKIDRTFREATKTLTPLIATPTHSEFHGACRVAVKATASHTQQIASNSRLNHVVQFALNSDPLESE